MIKKTKQKREKIGARKKTKDRKLTFDAEEERREREKDARQALIIVSYLLNGMRAT